MSAWADTLTTACQRVAIVRRVAFRISHGQSQRHACEAECVSMTTYIRWRDRLNATAHYLTPEDALTDHKPGRKPKPSK